MFELEVTLSTRHEKLLNTHAAWRKSYATLLSKYEAKQVEYYFSKFLQNKPLKKNGKDREWRIRNITGHELIYLEELKGKLLFLYVEWHLKDRWPKYLLPVDYLSLGAVQRYKKKHNIKDTPLTRPDATRFSIYREQLIKMNYFEKIPNFDLPPENPSQCEDMFTIWVAKEPKETREYTVKQCDLSGLKMILAQIRLQDDFLHKIKQCLCLTNPIQQTQRARTLLYNSENSNVRHISMMKDFSRKKKMKHKNSGNLSRQITCAYELRNKV